MSFSTGGQLAGLAFGDGSTGAATVSGALAAVPFYSVLTVAVSTTLTGANFHILASVAIALNGAISNTGNSTANTTGASNQAIASLWTNGSAGQSGTTTASTSSNGGTGTGYAGAGGGGGKSDGTNANAGTAGTVLATTVYRANMTLCAQAMTSGGSGVGGHGTVSGGLGRGSGDGTNAGGGSGGSAGPVFFATRNLIGGASGSSDSTGGSGGAGAAGTAGGGAGGAGHVVLTVWNVNTGTAITPTSAGGAPGTGQGGAGNGTNGVAGTPLQLVNT